MTGTGGEIGIVVRIDFDESDADGSLGDSTDNAESQIFSGDKLREVGSRGATRARVGDRADFLASSLAFVECWWKVFSSISSWASYSTGSDLIVGRRDSCARLFSFTASDTLSNISGLEENDHWTENTRKITSTNLGGLMDNARIGMDGKVIDNDWSTDEHVNRFDWEVRLSVDNPPLGAERSLDTDGRSRYFRKSAWIRRGSFNAGEHWADVVRLKYTSMRKAEASLCSYRSVGDTISSSGFKISKTLKSSPS